MRPYIFKIPAGAEDAQFFGEANVVYLSPRATVRVTVKNPDNEESFELTPGGSARLSRFNELRISHDGTGTETFTLYVGMNTEARTAQVSGNIQPVGGSDNTANPPTVQGIVDPVSIYPEKIEPNGGGQYTITTTLLTLISSSANVNGAWIITATLSKYTDYMGRLFIFNGTPTTANDGLGLLYNWGSYNRSTMIQRPLWIPAGYGLFCQTSGGTANGIVDVAWRLL